jgi:hypothetical protein
MNRQQWFTAAPLGVFDRTKPGEKDATLNRCQTCVCGVKIDSIAPGQVVNDEGSSTSECSLEQ